MSSNLIRWGGPAMMLGGLLWGLTYVVEMVIGVTLGGAAYNRADPSASLLEWFWPTFFMGAVSFLGVGQLGIWARLHGHAKMPGVPGALLACRHRRGLHQPSAADGCFPGDPRLPMASGSSGLSVRSVARFFWASLRCARRRCRAGRVLR